MGGVAFDDNPETPLALQTLAREQMKYRLLADIRMDIVISQIEGWDWRVYVRDLRDELDKILREGKA